MSLTPEQWLRVRAIFDGAVGLAADERKRYVADSCAGDTELHRQVSALLDSHARAGAFLETPAHVIVGASLGDTLLGRAIGSYHVESRLGAGGMGEVYLARDQKLHRPVAIKLLSGQLGADTERLRRFRVEAHSVSQLNHPNILVIHDFGEHEGRPYMVTEYVEGMTLRQRLQGDPIALHDAVAVGLQIANALASAHARGIVHRDVKPENVMIRPDGYVKVLDFGLAKLATEDAPPPLASSIGTVPGAVMGTPQYMSPEQARGLDLDARSDVWSLGAVLYEMLAGAPPFAAATTADVLAGILNIEPVPLELKAPSAPVHLVRTISKCLRKNRPERYPTASELAADLAALSRNIPFDVTGTALPAGPGLAQDGPDVPDSGSTPRTRLAKRTRLVVVPFRLLRPDPETDFLSFSLADAIATTLSGIDSLIVRSSLAATRFAAETLDLKRIADEAEIDAVLVGSLLRVQDTIRVTAQLLAAPQGTIIWSDRIDVAATDLIRIQDELTERIVDSLSLPLTVPDQQQLRRDAPASAKAYELYLRGNAHFYDSEHWPIARDLFVECVAEDPHYAPAWARLGRCYRLTAKFRSETVEEMRENLKRADIAFRTAFELNPDLPLAHHLYTPLETDLGRAEEALLRLVRRARQRRADAALYAGLVHACRYCGLLDASVAAAEQAKHIDPQISTGVALTYWMRGEYERALEGAGLHGFFTGLEYLSIGRPDEAIKAAEASANVVRDPTTRQYQTIVPLLIKGRTEECRRVLDELAPRNPDPESVFYIARTYAKLGAIDSAVTQFARSVDSGFCVPSTFARDPWLDSIRDQPGFVDALARAQVRHDQAARKFEAAGGLRLLKTSH